MGTFLEGLQGSIDGIDLKQESDEQHAALVADITSTVTAQVQPILDDVTDLKTALTEIVAKLDAGDTTAAASTASAALAASTSTTTDTTAGATS